MAVKYERAFVAKLEKRLLAEEPLIQVLVGPRQVGKTTGIKQLLERCVAPFHYASADDVLNSDSSWLLEQWQKAMLMGKGSLLAIDEVQKIPNWSESLKALWDKNPFELRVVVLGSSALQIQSGLTESLAGRFELTRIRHWTFAEMQLAFGYDLERFLRYGGYPGAVRFEDDHERWYAYLKDSIVEAVIGKDILLNRKVGNPALFRQAFSILCHCPACEISYTKLLGQLQDKGNTDLVKYYLELYAGAFLVHTLEKYSNRPWRTRSSSPKIIVACPALCTMAAGFPASADPEQRGHIFESAVGVQLQQLPGELFYWREGNAEVDFVYSHHDKLYAIEVKSGRSKSAKGLSVFIEHFPQARPVILTCELFPAFSKDPQAFLNRL